MTKFQVIAVLSVIAFATVATANKIPSADADCPNVCPALYAPLCAFNGIFYKQFDNQCLLQDSNCRIDRSWVAPFERVFDEWCTSVFVENLYEKMSELDVLMPECSHPCPMIYDPVCVSNGVYRGLVSSECEIHRYNKCFVNKIQPFKMLRKGNC